MEWIVRTLDGHEVLSSLGYGERLETTGVIIGSSPKADIVLAEASVADQHVRLSLGSGGKVLGIEDLGSGRETLVNGQRVRMPYEKMQLGIGSQFVLGHIALEVLARRNTSTAARPGRSGEAMTSEPLQGSSVPWNELEILLSTFDRWGIAVQCRIKRQPVVTEPVELCVIGRSASSCQFVVDVESISRPHAAIGYHPTEGWVIRDLDSRNGTLVNERVSVGSDWVPIEGRTVWLGQHAVNLSRIASKLWLDELDH